ncbi:MAG: hypothetical protein RLZZ293_90 [Pseudomonadota bacterium]|jgi:Xaa-Pro aminopeptidase
MTTIAQRLTTLRLLMQQNQIDIYIIPSIDQHNSEYVPECWQRRTWISNFDGSAGEVVVSLEHAYLSTDGRYFLQAEQQLDSNHFSLLKQSAYMPETELWLAKNCLGKTVAIDPQLLSVNRSKNLSQIITEAGGKLVWLETNLIDLAKNQLVEPLILPTQPAFMLTENTTGCSLSAKLHWLREQLNNHNADYIALNVLDEIAWLYNIRGSDIEYNPLVISYALVGQNTALWFVDSNKLNPQLIQQLANSGVELADYNQFLNYLTTLTGKIILDDKTANLAMLNQLVNNCEIIWQRSPIVKQKAQKNAIEIQGMRQAHLKDAVAVINFLHWIEHNWQLGINEIQAADKLAQFRGMQTNLHGLSFATISGYAENGAIIHYRATSATAKLIDDKNLFLLDSGGQYLEGTTDITRTLHLGQPTAEQRYHYSLVLKGHLNLARAKFPHGTCGEHLDALARLPLWSNGLNYRHGTGHGVGSFLCVHEGPQIISPATSGVALVPGMVVSNEPGFYIDGKYGIRIENLCLVQTIQTSNEYGKFYGFENLTLVPYWKNLIDLSLLNNEELAYLNEYYQQIQSLVLPLLEPQIQDWLINQLDIFN